MTRHQISIIIPIYNSGQFLEKCLNSICEQTFKNYEVILVDDGSTDRSSEICLEFQKKDSRFKYYYQSNSGVSSARNFGLKKVETDYTTFIDSDDFLDQNYLSNVFSETEKMDIIISGYKIVDKNFKLIEKRNSNAKILHRNELISKVLMDSSVFSFPWNKIFVTQIIKDNNILFFNNIKYGEDMIFNIQYLLHIKYGRISDGIDYNYVQHDTSASGSITKDGFLNRLTDLESIRIVIDLLKNETFIKERAFLSKRLLFEASVYYRSSKYFHCNKDVQRKLLSQVKELKRDYRKELSIKKKILLYLNINFPLFTNRLFLFIRKTLF